MVIRVRGECVIGAEKELREYFKIRKKLLEQYKQSLKDNPPKPKQCKFCGGEMKVVYDDFDSVKSKCMECGSIRYWEDSPVGFADYWKDNRSK